MLHRLPVRVSCYGAVCTHSSSANIPHPLTRSSTPSPPPPPAHTQVHKDVPRLLKGMLILGQDGGRYIGMTAPHGRRSRITQVHACMRTGTHTHTPLGTSHTLPCALLLLLTITHTHPPPTPTPCHRTDHRLKKADDQSLHRLDDPSITKLVEEQLPHYLNEDIGDVAGGLRHFLLESRRAGVVACSCRSVCPIDAHTHIPLRAPLHSPLPLSIPPSPPPLPCAPHLATLTLTLPPPTHTHTRDEDDPPGDDLPGRHGPTPIPLHLPTLQGHEGRVAHPYRGLLLPLSPLTSTLHFPPPPTHHPFDPPPPPHPGRLEMNDAHT